MTSWAAECSCAVKTVCQEEEAGIQHRFAEFTTVHRCIFPVSGICKSQNDEQLEKMLGRTHSASDAPAPEASQGQKAGVIPPPHKPLCHQPVQFALGQHIVCQVEASVLPDDRLVLLQHLHSIHWSNAHLKLPHCETPDCSAHFFAPFQTRHGNKW